MNDQNLKLLGAEKITSLALRGAWTAGEREPDTQDLLDRIALQARKIEALERVLAHSETEARDNDTVLLVPRLARAPRIAMAPARSQSFSPPWWPVSQLPSQAMEPPPGSRCFHLKGTGAKVIAFALFGLSGETLEKEVKRIAARQLKLGDFIPVFLTDAKDHEVFRRHHYAFEYFPHEGSARSAIDLKAIQPRLEFIESKWDVDLFINLGIPKGELIRRETRPARERYMLAKSSFMAGRYHHAKRLMLGFTETMVAEASYRYRGKPLRSPRATIIIISHRDHSGFEKGLASIASQVKGSNIEVILVDNGNGKMDQHGKALFGSFGLAEPGFNSGCSGARNLGAYYARGPKLIFLDDDGITTDGCVEALLSCIEETGAVAVRGRVMPLTSPELTGTHYDLGPARIPALNTTEGVSAWDRAAFDEAGGFDPLLAGHEGVELCSKLWRFHGPSGFLYEPNAVLLHDYAPSTASSDAKSQRYRANVGYLEFLENRYKDINSGHHRFISDPVLGYLSLRKPKGDIAAPRNSVSILTTAKDGLRFLAEYTRSLRGQTDKDFEVIFVDDHSTDGTAEEIARLWDGDPRLKVVLNPRHGRGSALNSALDHAKGEICLIADVDDLSVPERVALTRNFFSSSPGMECMSFVAYNESNPFRLGGLRTMFVDDVAVRQLFGMPVSFPAFAFLRKNFNTRFDEELQGGIDCDWMFRRSAKAPLQGKVVFFPAVYYREHEGQITAKKKGTQLDIRTKAIHAAYARVLGELNATDITYIQILADTRQATASVRNLISKWVAGFLSANRRTGTYDPDILDQALFEAIRELKIVAA